MIDESHTAVKRDFITALRIISHVGMPMFMERDEAEKSAKRTFKLASVERAWEHFAAKCAE